MTEQQLTEKAIAFLKTEYGEDTRRMDVVDNAVDNGNGVLHVDCTVSIVGALSNWTKWFTFQNGEVTSMRWQMR